MTSIGRGRGWAQNTNEQLRKPGRPSPSEDLDLANLINKISLIDDENAEPKIKEVVKFIEDKIHKEKLKEVYNKLYKRALSDPVFRRKLFTAHKNHTFRNLAGAESHTLQKYLITSIQADYERREELRDESIEQFRNFASFFCEVLPHLDVLRVQAIVQAFLNYMEMLLEIASVEDIEIFTEAIVLYGKDFSEVCKEEMDNLMISTRKVLIKEDLAPASRQMLLYVTDVVNRNFKPLPAKLQKFYESQLDKKFMKNS